MDDLRLREERVNLWTALIGVIVAIVGVAILIWVAADSRWAIHDVAKVWVTEVGALLFVTGLISLFWELHGKRVFLEEILAKAQLSRDVRIAGIEKIFPNFHSLEWDSYFRNATRLDIFFAYGSTWRRTHLHQVKALAARDHARIRIVLPDAEDAATMTELGRRFSITEAQMRDRVVEAEDEFKALARELGKGATIGIWRLKRPPLYTFYRLDNRGIVTLYHHGNERATVPALVLDRDGTLYHYFSSDIQRMIEDGGSATKAYDSAEQEKQ